MNDTDTNDTDRDDAGARIRQALGNLLDTAPAAPLSPRDLAPFTREPSRRYAPVLVGALAIAAVGAGGIVLANRSDRPDAGVADTTPTSTAAPDSTTPTTDGRIPIESRSQAWQQAVDAVIAEESGWGTLATEVTAADADPFSASVTASVGDLGRIVFDLQTLAEGEYSADPVWQMEVAGSSAPGVPTDLGTLFTVDAPGVRRAVVVSPIAIVTVHAEGIESNELPPPSVFSAAAEQLSRALPSVLAVGASEPGGPATSVPAEIPGLLGIVTLPDGTDIALQLDGTTGLCLVEPDGTRLGCDTLPDDRSPAVVLWAGWANDTQRIVFGLVDEGLVVHEGLVVRGSDGNLAAVTEPVAGQRGFATLAPVGTVMVVVDATDGAEVLSRTID